MWILMTLLMTGATSGLDLVCSLNVMITSIMMMIIDDDDRSYIGSPYRWTCEACDNTRTAKVELVVS